MQNDLIGNIAEVDVEHTDIPFQFGISNGAVRLVRVFPSPLARALGALGDIAAFVDVRIDEGNVTVVLLRLFVEKFKDTPCAREPHDDRVDLHGDLADVQRELAGHIQESRHKADHRDGCSKLIAPSENGKIPYAAHNEQACNDRRNDEHEVTYVHDRGHQDIAVGVRLVGCVAELVVDLVEIFLGAFLVAEYLDDLLAAHHLLDIALRFTDDFLLADKVFRAAAADKFGDERHDDDAEQYDQQKPYAVEQHDDQQRDRRDAGIEHLRDAHRYELTERIRIVGVHGHDVAVGMRIEVADGQRLHFGEHIVADVAQKALRNDRHRLVIEEGCAQSQNIHDRHAEDDPKQRA